MEWHNISAREALRQIGSQEKKGLDSRQVMESRKKNGSNRLTAAKKKSWFLRFLGQFSDFMVLTLLAAAVISFVTSMMQHDADFVDSIIILVIVTVNAVIGLIQESKAEKAIEALKKMSAPEAKVIRDGQHMKIPSEEVVVGDILVLETGDFVAADARLLQSVDLQTEESALTGESLPVEKHGEDIVPAGAPVGDRSNMVFATSSITGGHGTAVVVAVGMETQVGKIAAMLNTGETPQTPLQQRLAKTGKVLGVACVLICIAIFAMGLIQNIPPLEMFMISVSLAVAAIPEGLPAVVTIVLALGVKRMAANRAIIRKLPAVETLGSANVICSDKTGTLTQNRMTVVETADIQGKLPIQSRDGQELLIMAALCNNSELRQEGNKFQAVGEPTENALVTAAAENGKVKEQLEKITPRVWEIPFDSKRKRMTTIHALPNGKYRVITKGAPDVLLQYCNYVKEEGREEPLNQSRERQIMKVNEEMAARALRVLAVAYKDLPANPSGKEEAESQLVYCGMIGMIDPPRPEVKRAVRQCRRAGIRPVMITGDHVATAAAIAEELGILTAKDKAMTGHELDQISQEELVKNIYQYSVFARVSPEHKVRIVKAFQARGAVVAMTGDGVNDAPALKTADIGCAMGIGGTDVAKGAADMVLTDDNFATIVEAVKEGRGIYANIKKAVHFLLSCNIGEILTVLLAFLMDLPAPLLAIQLLWVNLVTDSLPALALGVEPNDPDIMKQKPINSRKSLFGDGLWYHIIIEGALIGSLALLAFVIGRTYFEVTIGRTMAFAVLSISQLVHAFNMRSSRSLFEVGVFSNKKMVWSFLLCLLLQTSVITVAPLAAIFKTASLNLGQWATVAGLSLIPLFVLEIEKRWRNRHRVRKQPRSGSEESIAS